jgi:hypothetical protein
MPGESTTDERAQGDTVGSDEGDPGRQEEKAPTGETPPATLMHPWWEVVILAGVTIGLSAYWHGGLGLPDDRAPLGFKAPLVMILMLFFALEHVRRMLVRPPSTWRNDTAVLVMTFGWILLYNSHTERWGLAFVLTGWGAVYIAWWVARRLAAEVAAARQARPFWSKLAVFRRTLLAAAICVLCFAVVREYALRPIARFAPTVTEMLFPSLIPGEFLAENLDRSDPGLVSATLGLLGRRRDPMAEEKAVPLLRSEDPYVWLHAATYLAAVDRREAVPYLIKALRHRAWRSRGDHLAALRRLTGRDFGEEFENWRQWWLAEHPATAFDLDSALGN